MERQAVVERYKRDDYVVIKGFLPASIIGPYKQFIQNALNHDVESVLGRWGLSVHSNDGDAQARTLLANASTAVPEDEQKVLTGHFPLSVRMSDVINPIAEFIGKSPIIRDILGSQQLYMHMPPMLRYVPPGYTLAAVPPHKDTSYNRHMSDFITIWTPMVPINQRCGGLVIYEGSQHAADTVKETQQFDRWLPPLDVSGYTRRQLVDLDLGDVVILSPQIIHESAANISDGVRLSMDLRIFGEDATSTKHCLDLQRLQILTSKAA